MTNVTLAQVQELCDAIIASGVTKVADVPTQAFEIIDGFAAQFGAEAAEKKKRSDEAFRHAESNYGNLLGLRAALNASNPADPLIPGIEKLLAELATAWPDNLPADLPPLDVAAEAAPTTAVRVDSKAL